MIEIITTVHPERPCRVFVLNDTFEGTSENYAPRYCDCWAQDVVKFSIDYAKSFHAERIRYTGPIDYCNKLVKETRKRIDIPVEVF